MKAKTEFRQKNGPLSSSIKYLELQKLITPDKTQVVRWGTSEKLYAEVRTINDIYNDAFLTKTWEAAVSFVIAVIIIRRINYVSGTVIWSSSLEENLTISHRPLSTSVCNSRE